jgi:hypothetical protein
MGGKDLSDHLDGKKNLVENHGIDASKGYLWRFWFITLMGMLTGPKICIWCST